jgi:hypothetical protein
MLSWASPTYTNPQPQFLNIPTLPNRTLNNQNTSASDIRYSVGKVGSDLCWLVITLFRGFKLSFTTQYDRAVFGAFGDLVVGAATGFHTSPLLIKLPLNNVPAFSHPSLTCALYASVSEHITRHTSHLF